MCNLSPNISSIYSQSGHKFFITRSKKRRRRALKKRYFVSSLSIWYKVLSPKINNTPFPNKFKTLFHSQMFLTRLYFSVSESKIIVCDQKQRTQEDQIVLPAATAAGCVCVPDLDFHKCRKSLEIRCKTMSAQKAAQKRFSMEVDKLTWSEYQFPARKSFSDSAFYDSHEFWAAMVLLLSFQADLFFGFI